MQSQDDLRVGYHGGSGGTNQRQSGHLTSKLCCVLYVGYIQIYTWKNMASTNSELVKKVSKVSHATHLFSPLSSQTEMCSDTAG